MVGMTQSKRRIFLNEPHLVTPVASALQSFQTDMIAPLKECRVSFSPVQEGTGDPSPSNVRPIMGWTGVDVWQTGRQLININNCRWGKWTNSSGVIENNSYGVLSETIPAIPNCQYAMGYYGVRPYSYSFIELDKNQTFIKRTHLATSDRNPKPQKISITTTENTRYIYVQTYVYGGPIATPAWLESVQWMAEIGSELHPYEPYQGTTIPIDWQSSAGTVYGGYVDLARGLLVAEYVGYKINQLTWGYSTYNNVNAFFTATDNYLKEWDHGENLFSEKYKSVSPVNWSSAVASLQDYSIVHYIASNSNYIYVKDSRFTVVSDFLNENGESKIAYKLSNPIVYQLDPITIKTLRGQNNIWSNANGNVELKYWKH